MTKIVFVQVQDTATKLLRIHEIALNHFQRQDPLWILVQDMAALEFLDTLLWRYPEESFVPHSTSGQDIITISTTSGPVPTLFNLCQTPVSAQDTTKVVYELEDTTSAQKKQASELRYQAYRQAGYEISYKTF